MYTLKLSSLLHPLYASQRNTLAYKFINHRVMSCDAEEFKESVTMSKHPIPAFQGTLLNASCSDG